MRHFEYRAARSTAEAVKLLSETLGDAAPIAGGTDLLVRIKEKLSAPKLLIDISGVPEFRGIELTEGGLRIGAMVTHTEIVFSSMIRKYAPVVAIASASVGSLQTRNLGTIGGNVMSCVPSNDSPPPLLVLDAQATVAGKKGTRQVALEELFLAPRCPAIAPDEILTEILIPAQHFERACSFTKFGRRKGMSLALVNVAASVRVDRTKKAFDFVRIALGAVAPTPIRARKAEGFLVGKSVNDETLSHAAAIAAEESKPIDDFRSSAQYRRDLIKVLTRRALMEALQKA